MTEHFTKLLTTSLKQISAEEFVDLLNKGEPLQNYFVSEQIVISPKDHRAIEIDSCVLRNVKFAPRSFESLKITRCKITEISMQRAATKSILIDHSRIHNLTFESNQIQSVDITESILFNIALNDAGITDLRISECRFRELDTGPSVYTINLVDLDCGKIRVKRNVNSRKPKAVGGLIRVTNVNGYSFNFSNSQCPRLNAENMQNCSLSYFNADLGDTFINNSLGLNISIAESGGKAHIQDSACEEIALTGSTAVSLIYVWGGHKKQFPNMIKKLRLIRYTPTKESRVVFTDCRIDEVVFYHSNLVALFQLNVVIVSKSLDIFNTNIGKTFFNNIDLRNAEVRLVDSDITETIFSNVTWNDDYKLCETDLDSKSVREAYRQLKANYIKNNNKIEALEFQKHELRKHFEILSKIKCKSWRNFGNYLVVGSNKVFSDFGQNIWKPVLFLFCFHIILFNCLLFANPELGFKLGWPINWDATWEAWSLYFQTILPTHHHVVEGFYDKTVSIGGFWDITIRIFAGYFIFYFITASRKYHQ